MSDVYEEAYHHLVWATKQREQMIVPRVESLLHAHIHQKCHEMRVFVHAVGGMPDHLHLVCSIPATLAVAEFLRRIKGASSHYINHHANGDPLCWQPGYGWLTCAKHDLPRVVSYVERQKTHHGTDRLWPRLENTSSVPEGLSPGSPPLPVPGGRRPPDPPAA